MRACLGTLRSRRARVLRISLMPLTSTPLPPPLPQVEPKSDGTMSVTVSNGRTVNTSIANQDFKYLLARRQWSRTSVALSPTDSSMMGRKNCTNGTVENSAL